MQKLGVAARTNEALIQCSLGLAWWKRKAGEGVRVACDSKVDIKQMQLN